MLRDVNEPQPNCWKWIDGLLLIVILAFAAWLRLTHIDSVLSFDEIWHLATTQGYGSPQMNYAWDQVHYDVPHMTSLDHAAPVWAIWHDMRGVLHPPLFLIALRLWREVCGDGDFAAHLFSISWSLVAIGFTFASARLSMNRWAAVLSGMILSCAQTQVYFAQEVRAYSMMVALGSISLWVMTGCEALGATRWRAVALALLSLLLVLTHYFTLGAAIAIGVYGVIRLRQHRRMFLAVLGTCAAFYLVAWVPFAIAQIKDFQTGDVLLKLQHRDVVFTTLMLFGAPFRLIAERDYSIELLPVFTGVLLVVPWFLVRRFPSILPWVLWITCSLAAIWVLDIARTTRHAAYIRYLAVATPAVPLLFVGVAWPLRRWLAYVIGSVAAFVGLIYLISNNRVPFDAQPYPRIASILSTHIAPGEMLISFENDPQAYWRAEVAIMIAAHEPAIFPRDVAILASPMKQESLAKIRTPSAWFIAPFGTRAEEVVPGSRVIESFRADENLQIDHLAIDSRSPTTAESALGSRDAATSIGDAVPSK